MRRFSLAVGILATAMLCSPLPAHAGAFYTGPYVMAGSTVSADRTRIPAQPTPLRDGGDFMGLSAGFGGWGGYRFDDLPISVEFASSARARHDQDIGFIDVTTNRLYSIRSNVSTVDNMVSLLYDLPFTAWGLQPYIGAGAGVVYAHLSQKAKFVNNGTAGNENTWNFAWQGQAGVKYPLEDNLELRFDYRYIDMGIISTGELPTGTNDRFDSHLMSQDLRAGITWKF